MTSLINILLVTSDHRLYRKHMWKVNRIVFKSWNIRLLRIYWLEHAPFKISLVILYSIVWIWGLTGKILYSSVWIWGLTGSFAQNCVDMGFNR